jgi:hypothetical protein
VILILAIPQIPFHLFSDRIAELVERDRYLNLDFYEHAPMNRVGYFFFSTSYALSDLQLLCFDNVTPVGACGASARARSLQQTTSPPVSNCNDSLRTAP